MVCVSISETSLGGCLEIMQDAQMVELRGDLARLSVEDISTLVRSHENVLFTCRLSSGLTDGLEYARERMIAAIEAGAKYIDIEIEAPRDYSDFIREKAKQHNAKFIVSYHDFETTSNDLMSIYNACCERGADIVKIVTTANTTNDAVKTLSLYKQDKEELKTPLIAFSMGKLGQFTRVLALKMGAEFTYVAPSEDKLTAPGQYTKAEMDNLLSDENYRFKAPKLPDTIFAENDISVSIPASKSIAQRAILAAALSSGESVLTNFEPCDDITMAIEVVRGLGAEVLIQDDRLVIRGIDNVTELDSINVGESGLLTRLIMPMSGYFAEKNNKSIKITGRGSLLKRNLQESVEALTFSGLSCRSMEASGGGYLPLEISGAITARDIEIDGERSSQIVSGFLMTLPLLGHDTNLEVRNPTSIPYIHLTLDLLKQFGIEIVVAEQTPEKMTFKIKGNQEYIASTIALDSDWSSAAFFAVAGRIAEGLYPEKCFKLGNMPLGSSQADEAITWVLEQCGNAYPFKPFAFDATNSPDLFPILAVLACHCDGVSQIKGVSRLSEKESNRAEAIYMEFTRLGADVDLVDDTMYIKGGKLSGGNGSSHNDHRMAMCLIIASLFIEEDVYLDNIKCIDKSFPAFLEKLGVK